MSTDPTLAPIPRAEYIRRCMKRYNVPMAVIEYALVCVVADFPNTKMLKGKVIEEYVQKEVWRWRNGKYNARNQ